MEQIEDGHENRWGVYSQIIFIVNKNIYSGGETDHMQYDAGGIGGLTSHMG